MFALFRHIQLMRAVRRIHALLRSRQQVPFGALLRFASHPRQGLADILPPSLALGAIKAERKEATIDDLQAHLDKRREETLGSVSFALGRDDREGLLAYGRERGLTDMAQILGFVVAQAIAPRRAA